jgi:hypothetical protein
MAIYAGEGMVVVCQATDPATTVAITDATAQVDFFAPGKNPISTVADRVVDRGPFDMTYDPTVVNKDGSKGAYTASIDTTGWVAGKWTYRVTISDVLDSWEFSTVTLKA